MIFNLIINIVLLGLFVWLVGLLPLPDAFQKVILVLALVVVLLWVVGALAHHTYVPLLGVV